MAGDKSWTVLSIKAEGETNEDVADAVEEALRRFREGFTSGFDRNDSGSFTFEVEVV